VSAALLAGAGNTLVIDDYTSITQLNWSLSHLGVLSLKDISISGNGAITYSNGTLTLGNSSTLGIIRNANNLPEFTLGQNALYQVDITAGSTTIGDHLRFSIYEWGDTHDYVEWTNATGNSYSTAAIRDALVASGVQTSDNDIGAHCYADPDISTRLYIEADTTRYKYYTSVSTSTVGSNGVVFTGAVRATMTKLRDGRAAHAMALTVGDSGWGHSGSIEVNGENGEVAASFIRINHSSVPDDATKFLPIGSIYFTEDGIYRKVSISGPSYPDYGWEKAQLTFSASGNITALTSSSVVTYGGSSYHPHTTAGGSQLIFTSP
jgi:hypothetical protein